MKNIILYSTHCPKCNVLKRKLQEKEIGYKEINDVNIMKEKGYLTVPVLEVNGTVMNFKEAFKYVDNLK